MRPLQADRPRPGEDLHHRRQGGHPQGGRRRERGRCSILFGDSALFLEPLLPAHISTAFLIPSCFSSPGTDRRVQRQLDAHLHLLQERAEDRVVQRRQRVEAARDD